MRPIHILLLTLGVVAAGCKRADHEKPESPASESSSGASATSPAGGKAAAEPSPPATDVDTPEASADVAVTEEAALPSPDDLAVRQLRAHAEELLGAKVQVTGYITSIYDCATAFVEEGMSQKEAERLVAKKPERCERPNFYLGESPEDPVAKSIWVVEVPRPPTPDERRVLPKEEIENWPEVPEVEVGDRVIVTGEWTTRSALGFRKDDGLLVYKDLEDAD